MPRGKYVNHKGRSRHFTSPEELEQELEDSKKKKRRPKADDESGSESESEGAASQEGEDGSEEEDSDEDDENAKAKGVSNLIEIENPNRAQKKAAQKVTKISTGEKAPKPELSRREREEVEKQRAAAHYQKMHAEGKTEQARADLARLAIIKQHRAEAAARREAEKKEKEDKRKAGSAPAR